MKAIVLDVKKEKAALLFEDGTTGYRRLKAKPGEMVEVRDENNTSVKVRALKVAAAAAAFAVVLLGGGYYELTRPVSYVSVDVNPSMEYTLNRLDKVVAVEALNEDAARVISDMDESSVKGKSISEAVGDSEEVMRRDEYLDSDGYMLISVTSDSASHRNKIEQSLEEYIKEKETEGLTCSMLDTSSEERAEAKRLSMSTGRYASMIAGMGKDAASDDKAVRKYKTMPVSDMVKPSGDRQQNDVQDSQQQGSLKENVPEIKGGGTDAYSGSQERTDGQGGSDVNGGMVDGSDDLKEEVFDQEDGSPEMKPDANTDTGNSQTEPAKQNRQQENRPAEDSDLWQTDNRTDTGDSPQNDSSGQQKTEQQPQNGGQRQSPVQQPQNGGDRQDFVQQPQNGGQQDFVQQFQNGGQQNFIQQSMKQPQ